MPILGPGGPVTSATHQPGLDFYEQVWKRVVARCPMGGDFMAQEWVKFAFREIVDKRKWSWLLKRGQFLMLNQYITGNVDVTFQSNQVVGHGTVWTASMVGLQFRIGLLLPIYTITAIDTVNQIITLDDTWGGPTALAQGYQIYLAYAIPPSDFHSFISVWDPQFSWRLWSNVKQDELNLYDAQRSAQGTAYVVADFDYTNLALGGATLSPPVPRFEIWPHQVSQKAIPFMYESRPGDLDDAGQDLPRFIRGDVLLEGALAQAARWPGSDRQHPNPYFNLDLAKMHEAKFQAFIREMERQDDEIYGRDADYARPLDWGMAPWPFPVNSSYLQTHSF